jgi:hypothetical protein
LLFARARSAATRALRRFARIAAQAIESPRAPRRGNFLSVARKEIHAAGVSVAQHARRF